jgi:hypothetical protein
MTPDLMNQLPAAVIKPTEQVETATGINILSSLGARQPVAVVTAEAEGEAKVLMDRLWLNCGGFTFPILQPGD